MKTEVATLIVRCTNHCFMLRIDVNKKVYEIEYYIEYKYILLAENTIIPGLKKPLVKIELTTV